MRWLRRVRRGRRTSGPVPAAGDADPVPTARTGARPSAWLAVGALLVAVLAGPTGGGIGAGAFAEVLAGAVEVRTDEGWVGLADGAAVPAGQVVRATDAVRLDAGDAVLSLTAGAELHTDPAAPELRRGSLLVEADAPYTARRGATRVEGRGEFRLDVGVATRVATYRGRASLDDGARTAELARFRQAPLRGGAIEDDRRPLRYLAGDAWDERLLADAFAVDRLVARLRDTLARDHGEEPRSAPFYDAFVAVDGVIDDGLDELATVRDEDRIGPPAEILVGVAVVDALVDDGHDVDDALRRVVTLRRAGAEWGLVLLEHGLGPAALRDAADRALERVAEQPPPPEPDPAGATEEDPAPAADADEEPPPAPEPGPGPDPEPSPAPPPEPEDDEDPGGPLAPVEDTVRDLGGTVGDLIEDTTDTVGDVVGGVDDLLAPSGTEDDDDAGDDDAGDGDAAGSGLLGG